MNLQDIIDKLRQDERNKDYTERGIDPIFQIHEEARILIIGQAPGRKVEESGIPFHDKSGETLMEWMGIDSSVFYSTAVSIMPMDFYYPGKAKTGNKPPRKFIDRDGKKLRSLFARLFPTRPSQPAEFPLAGV